MDIVSISAFVSYDPLKSTYLLASLSPQSSEQYLEPDRAPSTHPGPSHCLGTESKGASIIAAERRVRVVRSEA